MTIIKTSTLFTASRRLRLAGFAAMRTFGLTAIQPAQASYFTNTGAANTGRWTHTATLLANADLVDPASGTWRPYATGTGTGTGKITNIFLPFSLFSPAKQGFIRVSTQ